MTAEEIVDLGLRQSRRPQNATTRAAGLAWLNEGYLKVLNDQRDWSFLRGSGDVNVPVGTLVLLINGAGGIGPTLTVTIDRIVDVWSWAVADSYRLDPVYDYDEFVMLTAQDRGVTSTPTKWSTQGDNLYFNTTTDDTRDFKFSYKISTPRLALSDTPLIPDAHQGVLASYVAYKNWLEFSGGQASREAAMHMQEFQAALEAMRSRYASAPSDQIATGYGEISPIV